MQILLGNFSARLWTENIFKLTVGYESLHEISDTNGVTVANFITWKM
jgi:hypothetical protein